jgi:ABC-type multidrug transport system permease subunit
MFCLRTAFLNIRRHKQKSILVVLISLLVAFFAFVYLNSIQTSQQELDALPQSIPVTARIENLNGSQIVGLEISESLLDNVRNSGYVKDLYYSVQLDANFADVPNEKDKPKKIFLKAVNDINAIPNYEDNNIQLKNSVDLGFLKGKDALCIADDVFMQMNDLSIGDDIEINLYALEYDSQNRTFTLLPVGKCSLLIVGSMSSTEGEMLLCPAGWAKEKLAAADVDFYPDSAMFTVADPMKLDAFKAAMKKCFLMPVNPLADATIYGSALSVKDETFIKTATRLQNNLAVLYTFAPMVFVVIALVGYALSYLLMQTRRVEVVLMRSLGTSRAACVLVMLFEYAALGLLGALLGIICSAVLAGFAGAAPLLAFLLFFVSFVIGTAGAAFQISRRTAMSGFVKVEA